MKSDLSAIDRIRLYSLGILGFFYITYPVVAIGSNSFLSGVFVALIELLIFYTYKYHMPAERRANDRWQTVPVALVDKSTLGQLLVGRAMRDPCFRIVETKMESPNTLTRDDLYDRDLDG